ncbi:hypothetical protein AB4Z13_14410 [Rhizobium sp. YAF28]|uniref:hypothetical protein n=1 Tax=Rhizobium sp. YAF28 TaxID=3233081 RepID=UPI003F97F21F
MSALSADRNTPRVERGVRVFPVAAGAVLFYGAQAAINAAGNAVPVTTALGLKGAGRVEKRADNTGGAAGAINVEVAIGTFRFNNSAGGDLITKADIGSDAYGVDDQTVAKTSASNTRSVVGKIYDVDDLGVWVMYS